MTKLLAAAMAVTMATHAAELSTKKALNLATLKALATAAEAEAQKRNVQVTICVVDDSGNLLFLEICSGPRAKQQFDRTNRVRKTLSTKLKVSHKAG